MTFSRPRPGYAVASMKRTSPPTAVTARPVATPGILRPLPRTSPENRRGPSHDRVRRSSIRVDPFAFPSATRLAAFRQSAAIWRSRFLTPASRVYSRITVRSAPFGEAHPRRPEAVRLELLRDEVALGDPELLVLGVAREVDDVHPVEERPAESSRAGSRCR